MVRVEKVLPDGLCGPNRVAPGDHLAAINGVLMRDLLDIRFAAADERLDVEFVRPNGSRFHIQLSKHPDEDLGLEFEPMKIRACNNKCDFCFVFQQPKKTMRRELYIMDDDFRYSFLYGNFITLTNIDENDVTRIIEQRLSPLYISVHCTDDKVRREFLRSPDAWPIMPLLKRLADAGIRMHTQVVLVPDFNDGEILDRTINDLVSLYPMVESLAVVPVGLTRYRLDLPNVKPVTRTYARNTVKYLSDRTETLRDKLGVGFVYTADEFFVLAKRPFPRAPYYDDFTQLENGIGMARQLLDHFTREQKRMPSRLAESLHVYWVTGKSAATFLGPRVIDPLRRIGNLSITPVAVTNNFYGDTVTVSGLLTGRDILESLIALRPLEGIALLPPNCLNTDGLFLDDLTPGMLSAELGIPVLSTEYRFMPALRSLLMAPPSLRAVRAA
jgi:putative radical SAM enzyme (TIGR03279 family)